MDHFKWRFAPSGHNTKRGINDAGIESFTGARIESLTREIIQNSLDANNSLINNEPVKIEFSKFNVNRKTFPDVDNLQYSFEQCLLEVSTLKGNKPKDFFKHAIDVIKNENIPFLRISDFNTVGLKGVEKTDSSDWYNLVRSQGVSDKGSTDGGSFGIGKNAAFACSDLRTVIYSTHTVDDEVGTQGVANLISYNIGDDGDFTQGTGYLGIGYQNKPLLELTSLDINFARTEPGTDIFIAGILENERLDEEIIVSALNSFLYAIHMNTLEIKVNKTLINKNTLNIIMPKYQDKLKIETLEFYRLLNDKNTLVYQESIYGAENDIEIRLMLEDGASRKVSMIRKPWMKIKEMDNFPKQYKFFGATIIKGNSLNQLLRKVENPRHDNWEPDRIISEPHEYRLINQLIAKIHKVIREKLDKLHEIDLVDYLDIFGADEYLPLNDPGSKRKAQSRVEDKVKNIKIKETATSPIGRDIQEIDEGDSEIDAGGDIEIDTEDNPNPNKEKSKIKRDEFDKVLKNNARKVTIRKEDIRIIAIDRHQGWYRFFIAREKQGQYHIKFHVLDEQGESIRDVLLLEDVNLKKQRVDLFENHIQNINLEVGTNVLDVKINIKEYISIGVEMYEV